MNVTGWHIAVEDLGVPAALTPARMAWMRWKSELNCWRAPIPRAHLEIAYTETG